MRRLLVNMQNALYADMVAETLRRSYSDYDVHKEEDPEKVVDTNRWLTPYALLMEVTGYPPYRLEERLKIRDAVIKKNPECKIVLVVDERVEKGLADSVKQAKRDGLIDQFIFTSVSAKFMTALLNVL